MIDYVDEVKVRYFATFRETGRRCEVDRVMVQTPGLIEEWDRKGWTVSTSVECSSVPVFGLVSCYGVGNLNKVASLELQLADARAERDEYRARLNGR